MVEPYEFRRQAKPRGAVRPNALPSPVALAGTTAKTPAPRQPWLMGPAPAQSPRSPIQAAAQRGGLAPVRNYRAGTGGFQLGSTTAPRSPALPSPVDAFGVAMTPQNFNEVWGARKAQAAGSMPALAHRSPIQQPAMPANPSPLGTYANPDRGGYRFGFPQQAATPAPMPSPVRAAQQQAATLAQSFDRLRERSQAAPFGTYLAGTPETIGNLTEGRPWIDPAKTVTETMTWPKYVMVNRAQMAAMQQGRPFDLTPAWIGSSGRQTPPTTWDLAKQKSSTTGEGTVAEAIRSRAAERKLKEEPRRAMVTAKAQGRRISPVQAGIEAALTAGRGLTEDQLRAAYGPTYDQIQAKREDSSNKLLAGIAAAIGGAMQPGPNGEPAASPLTISSIFGPLLNRAMGQEGGAPTMPWPGAAPDNSPYGKVSRAFGLQPELFAQFNEALNAGDFDTARKMGRGVAQDQETVAAVEALIRAYEGSPPPLPKRPAQVSSEAMKRLEEKAAAGDQKAQQVLEEHKRTWPGGVQDKGYFIGEGGVYF